MAGAMMNDETAAGVAPIEIRLNDAIVRGEASLLRAADLQSVLLGWSNGLLAIADSAVRIHGGTVMPRDAEVTIELDHVTSVAGAEWLRVVNGFDAPFLPRLAIRCADGLLISAARKPLLEYEGVDALYRLLSELPMDGRSGEVRRFRRRCLLARTFRHGRNANFVCTRRGWRIWGPSEKFARIWQAFAAYANSLRRLFFIAFRSTICGSTRPQSATRP